MWCYGPKNTVFCSLDICEPVLIIQRDDYGHIASCSANVCQLNFDVRHKEHYVPIILVIGYIYAHVFFRWDLKMCPY